MSSIQNTQTTGTQSAGNAARKPAQKSQDKGAVDFAQLLAARTDDACCDEPSPAMPSAKLKRPDVTDKSAPAEAKATDDESVDSSATAPVVAAPIPPSTPTATAPKSEDASEVKARPVPGAKGRAPEAAAYGLSVARARVGTDAGDTTTTTTTMATTATTPTAAAQPGRHRGRVEAGAAADAQKTADAAALAGKGLPADAAAAEAIEGTKPAAGLPAVDDVANPEPATTTTKDLPTAAAPKRGAPPSDGTPANAHGAHGRHVAAHGEPNAKTAAKAAAESGEKVGPAVRAEPSASLRGREVAEAAREQAGDPSLEGRIASAFGRTNDVASLETRVGGEAAVPLVSSALASAGIASTLSAMPSTSGTPVATYTLPTPVSSPRWSDDFAEIVSVSIRDRVQEAEVRLEPRDMGPITLRLSLDGDVATLAFSAQHPETQARLEGGLDRLRDVLAQSGIQLGNATVDGGAAQGDRNAGANARPPLATRLAPEPAPAEAAARTLTPPRGRSLVDTFA